MFVCMLDIYFSPMNANAPNEREAERLQVEWEQLHHRAFVLAESLLRERLRRERHGPRPGQGARELGEDGQVGV